MKQIRLKLNCMHENACKFRREKLINIIKEYKIMQFVDLTTAF